MSNSLLSLYGDSIAEGETPELSFPNLPDRTQCLEQVAQSRGYDLVVLGGGLTGAITAHQASLLGMRVLVLHESYFGSTAQVWSVGYRKLFRSPVVARLRGVWAVRSTVDLVPEHLRRSRELHVAIEGRSIVDAWMQRLCCRNPTLPKGELPECDLRATVRETVLAARQEGAVCLSDVAISFVEAESTTGLYTVGVRDRLSEWSSEVRAGSLLLDPSIVRIPASRLGRRIGPQVLDNDRYVRVVCRLEGARDPNHPQVVIGSCEGREYQLASTSVPGLVEVVVLDGGTSATGWVEKICTLERVTLREILFMERFRQEGVARHTVEQYGGLFVPRERGPWDSWLSALRVVGELQRVAHPEEAPLDRLVPRRLSGALQTGDIESFRAAAVAAQVPHSAVARAVERWHGRVRYIATMERGFEVVCPDVLRGEVELAYCSDHVATIEDLLFGSLALDTDPQWREKVAPLAAVLSEISGKPTPALGAVDR